MDEKYKLIKPADVYYGLTKGEPSEAELWMGKVPNAYGNYASGNDFIDLFAGLIRKYGHMPVKSYAARMGVERTFAWFESCRRPSKDHEHQCNTSKTMIKLFQIRLILNKIQK